MAPADIDSQWVDTESEALQPLQHAMRASRFSVPLVFAIVALTGCAFAMRRWSALPPVVEKDPAQGTLLTHRIVADVRAIQTKDSPTQCNSHITASKEFKNIVTDVFDAFDHDRDGYLDDDEIQHMRKHLSDVGTAEITDSQLESVDKHGDGKLNPEDLFPLLCPIFENLEKPDAGADVKEKIYQEIHQAYDLLDYDGSGDLADDEIRKLLTMLPGAPEITDSKLEEIIKDVDEDGDGKFGYPEVVKFLTPILEKNAA